MKRVSEDIGIRYYDSLYKLNHLILKNKTKSYVIDYIYSKFQPFRSNLYDQVTFNIIEEIWDRDFYEES